MTHLIGSKYFFSSYYDFTPKDVDKISFDENPKIFKDVLNLRNKKEDIYIWRKMSANEFVDYTLNSNNAMLLGKFLVKEVCDEIDFTIEHLKKLQSVAERLDDKHKYEKVIYDSYIENGSYTLTLEQRDKAYEVYKYYRKETV